MDIFHALEFLHNRDPLIMHRDIKPGNFLITADYTTMKLVKPLNPKPETLNPGPGHIETAPSQTSWSLCFWG